MLSTYVIYSAPIFYAMYNLSFCSHGRIYSWPRGSCSCNWFLWVASYVSNLALLFSAGSARRCKIRFSPVSFFFFFFLTFLIGATYLRTRDQTNRRKVKECEEKVRNNTLEIRDQSVRENQTNQGQTRVYETRVRWPEERSPAPTFCSVSWARKNRGNTRETASRRSLHCGKDHSAACPPERRRYNRMHKCIWPLRTPRVGTGEETAAKV